MVMNDVLDCEIVTQDLLEPAEGASQICAGLIPNTVVSSCSEFAAVMTDSISNWPKALAVLIRCLLAFAQW